MLKSKCYTHFPSLPTVSLVTAEKCMTASYAPPPKPLPGQPIPQGFTYCPELGGTKFLQDLQTQFGRVEDMCMSFAPHTIYDWHTDIFVKVRLNYVLNDVIDAMTLFKEPTQTSNIVYNIEQCKYTVRSATLFNSQVEHCVINNSDQTRYLLSIRFFDNNVTFDQVENFLFDYKSDEQL